MYKADRAAAGDAYKDMTHATAILDGMDMMTLAFRHHQARRDTTSRDPTVRLLAGTSDAGRRIGKGGRSADRCSPSPERAVRRDPRAGGRYATGVLQAGEDGARCAMVHRGAIPRQILRTQDIGARDLARAPWRSLPDATIIARRRGRCSSQLGKQIRAGRSRGQDHLHQLGSRAPSSACAI